MSFYDGCGTSCSAHLGMKKASITPLLKGRGTAEHFSQIYPVCIEKKFFGRVLHMEIRKKVFFIRKTRFLFRMFRAP